MRRAIVAMGILAMVAGCQFTDPGASPTGGVAGLPEVLPVARCDDVAPISAPADWYRPEPIYVGNEQPTDELRAWAAEQPGFVEIWIDREHGGWVTLAFTEGAEDRQTELEAAFPDVGVVAVEVDWTMDELMALQERIGRELAHLAVGSGIYVMQGVVGVSLGVLRADRVAAVAEGFAGEPVCVEGIDPAKAPAAGPQQPAGVGWRLLADEPNIGEPYRTGIATDDASYAELWRTIGLPGDPPPVDFQSEVAVWFGAVFGSSCPNLRLDDVVVDAGRALLHAEIVDLDAGMACTADARPRAYVVAVERLLLPAGPFAIQLRADDPPSGVPEERTLVRADLTPPGAVAGLDDIGFDPTLMEPEPFAAEPGGFVETGFPFPYRFSVHCGIEWLGNLNGVEWRTDVPAGAPDFVPDEWLSEINAATGALTVEILLSEGPDPTLEATLNGHTVTYRPALEDPPGCR